MGKQVSISLQIHSLAGAYNLDFLSYGFPSLKLLFLHGRPYIDPPWLDAISDECIKEFLTNVALSNKIFLNFLWYYNLCNKVKELVALLGVGICETSHGQFKCSSLREKALRPSRYDDRCLPFAVDVPAISFASSDARRASSGAMRSNFVPFGFKLIPTRPPETFTDRFICSRAWSAPSAHKATS